MSQLGMKIFLGSTWLLAEHSFEDKDLFPNKSQNPGLYSQLVLTVSVLVK